MIRLALRVPAEHAELVLAELLELAPGGVEESERDGVVEYAVYGAPGELPDLPDLQAAAGGVPVEVSTSELPDDWSERWKQFHVPVLIEPPQAAGPSAGGTPPAPVPALYVRPPWSPPTGARGAREIVIDPGQAFGTGSHATTRLCLELLLALAAQEPGRGPVLDVGAGSGVLAIAAAQLGYAPVVASDYDPQSVDAIAANAAANGVEVQARRWDLRHEALPALGEQVVLANLLRPLLLELAETMQAPPLHLIASGLLAGETGEVAEAFEKRHGMRQRARLERGEWAALWLQAPPLHEPSPPCVS